MNGLTNATSKDMAWCPKHQIVKSVLSVRRHYPKRDRFTENLSIYPFSPAPNSPLQNSSNFGATASHWRLYILLFFFFLILTGWMRGALCVATHLYISYQAADESTSGWEFFGNSKIATIYRHPKSGAWRILRKMNICKGVTVPFKKFLNLKNFFFFFVCAVNPLFFFFFFLCVSSQPAFFFLQKDCIDF